MPNMKQFRAKPWLIRVMENLLRSDHKSHELRRPEMPEETAQERAVREALQGQSGGFKYDPNAVQQQINQRGYGVEDGQVVPGGVNRGAMHYTEEGELVELEERPKASMARLAASFENAQDVSEHEVRHQGRRLKAMEALITGLHTRVDPNGKVEYIGLDKAHALMEEYKQAREEGFTDQQLEIVPLSSYHAKLFPEGKKPIRQLMAGEWGTIHRGKFAGTVLILSDSDIGSAPMVTVPRQPEPQPGQLVTAQGKPHPGLLPGPEGE